MRKITLFLILLALLLAGYASTPLNAQNKDGDTLLRIAVKYGHIDTF